jgi:dCMP deaminase
MTDWDRRFLDLCEHIATWSKDPSTKLGSVIVDDKKRIVSVGYNGFPRGVFDYEERYNDRPTKHLFVAHAERNALDNSPMIVENCTLYVPLMPCSECAKSIIQRGITRVVTYIPEREGKEFNWPFTQTMFSEAGVELSLLARLEKQE